MVENNFQKAFDLMACDPCEKKLHCLGQLTTLEERATNHCEEWLSPFQHSCKDPCPKEEPHKENTAILRRSAQQCPATRPCGIHEDDTGVGCLIISIVCWHELSINRRAFN